MESVRKNGGLYSEIEENLKDSYSSQKEFIEKLFNDLLTLQDNDIFTLLQSLLNLVQNFEFPIVLLLNNENYLAVLGDLFWEESFNGLIWAIIDASLEKFKFESRIGSSIEKIYELAENLGLDINYIQVDNISYLESTYLEYCSLITDCQFLKVFMEDTGEVLEENNIKEILMRLNKMINNKLKVFGINYANYVYDFFGELSQNLSEYEEYFSKKVKLEAYNPSLEKSNNLNINNINTPIPNFYSSLDPKERTSFYFDEFIHIDEGMSIEYKNYRWPLSSNLVDTLKQQICGFLNAQGGRIYIGITDEKIVKGTLLKRKKRDNVRNEIANFTYDFFPQCRTNKIEVVFLPVKNKNYESFIENVWVIKIIVKQGDVDKLYSVTNRSYISYMRMPGQCVTLSAMEICEEIIRRKTNPRVAIDEKEFKDIQPEIPIENNKNSDEKFQVDSIFEKFKKSNSRPRSQNNIHNNNSKNITFNKNNQINQNDSKYTIAVQGIPTNVPKNNLLMIFKNTKYISERIFIKNDLCLGWAYFNYATYQDSEDALKKTKGATINGSKLLIKLKEK
jgi:hypothetical protein